MTILRGTRCRLRPIRRSDATVSIGWRNDIAIRNAVLGYPFPVTEEMERGWYDQVLADQGGRRASFAIELDAREEPAGFTHLTNINGTNCSADFGIVIGEPALHGKGIGTEATRLTIDYAFDTLNLERIELRVAEFNAAARRIYEKLGFVTEGRLRRAAYVAGKSVDVIVMGLLRQDLGR